MKKMKLSYEQLLDLGFIHLTNSDGDSMKESLVLKFPRLNTFLVVEDREWRDGFALTDLISRIEEICNDEIDDAISNEKQNVENTKDSGGVEKITIKKLIEYDFFHVAKDIYAKFVFVGGHKYEFVYQFKKGSLVLGERDEEGNTYLKLALRGGVHDINELKLIYRGLSGNELRVVNKL